MESSVPLAVSNGENHSKYAVFLEKKRNFKYITQLLCSQRPVKSSNEKEETALAVIFALWKLVLSTPRLLTYFQETTSPEACKQVIGIISGGGL